MYYLDENGHIKAGSTDAWVKAKRKEEGVPDEIKDLLENDPDFAIELEEERVRLLHENPEGYGEGDGDKLWDDAGNNLGLYEEAELDTLDERAGGVGQEQVDALLSQSPSEGSANEWSVETAKKGGKEDRVHQEMPEEEAERQALQSAQWSALLAQSAARKALMEEKGKGKGERKRLSSPEIQDLFRDDAAVLYGEEQDPQALGAERAVETWGRVERYGKQAQKRAQKAAEKDEQAEYRADQRTMATPGYGKSIDNPFGKK